MIRKRKKLNTITNTSVKNAASTLPVSQRPLTRRTSFLDLQRLALVTAPRARAEEPARAAEGDRRQAGEAHRLPPSLVGDGSGRRRQLQKRRVGRLVAEDVAGVVLGTDRL